MAQSNNADNQSGGWEPIQWDVFSEFTGSTRGTGLVVPPTVAIHITHIQMAVTGPWDGILVWGVNTGPASDPTRDILLWGVGDTGAQPSQYEWSGDLVLANGTCLVFQTELSAGGATFMAAGYAGCSLQRSVDGWIPNGR